MLRHTIFAIAASQAASISTDIKLDSFKALWHKQNAIRLLRKSFETGNSPSSAVLFACIIMLIFEVSSS
jgi:hypothetical protein